MYFLFQHLFLLRNYYNIYNQNYKILLLNYTKCRKFAACQIVGSFIIFSIQAMFMRTSYIGHVEKESIQCIIICGRVMFQTQAFEKFYS